MTPERAEALGYFPARVLPRTGKVAGVILQLYTAGLFINVEEDGNDGCYHYENYAEATIALAEWDGAGDPPGPWIKAKVKGGEDRPGPGAKPKEGGRP